MEGRTQGTRGFGRLRGGQANCGIRDRQGARVREAHYRISAMEPCTGDLEAPH